jgi:hypothetical protein
MFKSAMTTLNDFRKELTNSSNAKNILTAANQGMAHHEFHYALNLFSRGAIIEAISKLILAFGHKIS